jgi:transcriptional regulator with XRE-family HTH domain
VQDQIERKVTFSERLRSQLEAKGENASDLAKAVGVSHVAIGNLLKGQKPRSDLLFAIAQHFGVSMDYFYGGPIEPIGWESTDPIPEKPSLEQWNAMLQVSQTNAEATIQGAKQFGKLEEMRERIQSLERTVPELRDFLEEMVAFAHTPVRELPRPSSSKPADGIAKAVRKGFAERASKQLKTPNKDV